MLAYIFTVILGLCVFKVIQTFIYMRDKRRLFHTLPDVPNRHWFWGYLHLVENLDDILKIVGQYVKESTPTLFTTWFMFFYPVVNPMHPDTLKTVLTAKNVPKHLGIAGPYRVIKPWIGDGLLVSSGKKWERNRRLLTPAFHFDILRSYLDVFNHISDTFVTCLAEASLNRTSVNIYPMVSRATLDTMLRCTLSYEDESIQSGVSDHPYVKAVNRLTNLVVHRSFIDHFTVVASWLPEILLSVMVKQRARTPHYLYCKHRSPLSLIDFIYYWTPKGREFRKLANYVHKFSSEIIQARKEALINDPDQLKKRHLDFLDTLLAAKDEEGNGLTDLEIRDEVDTFMFEGHDTTASAISWSLYALAKYPTMQHMVREEIQSVLNGRKYLDIDDLPNLQHTSRFLKEVLRLYSPVPVIQRSLVEPLTVQGITFQPGQVIDLYLHTVHHNPALWENPEEFCPDRFLPQNITKRDPFAYIPFSAGPRNCIGQNFAMNEMKIFVCKVVSRFKISLDPGKEAIPFPEVVMRSRDGIYLNFEKT